MTEDNGVLGDGNAASGRNLWAYGYELIPPHREDRMTAIQRLIEEEDGEARRNGRNWTARMVTEEQVTHLLIVSASSEVDLEINQKLEAALKTMGIDYQVTIPMPFAGEG